MSSMGMSVGRACKILELVGPRKGGLRLTEISKELNVPVSSLSSILASLVAQEYLTVNAESRRYELGPKPLILASCYLSFLDIVRIGQPIVHEVLSQTDESSALVIRKGSEIIVVLGESSSQALRRRIEIGHRAPIYLTASGKAILAYQPEKEIENYLSDVQMVPATRSTITDPEILRRQLKDIREGKLAYNREEEFDGMIAVAAPILDIHGRSASAIVVNVPSVRFTEAKEKLIDRVLRDAAAKLSSKLGYQPKEMPCMALENSEHNMING